MPQRLTADQRFGLQVKSLRQQRGLTMKDLAEELRSVGFSQFHTTTVSRLERGERKLGLAEAEALASVLDSSVEALLSGTNNSAESIQFHLRIFLRRLESASEALSQVNDAAFQVSAAVLTARNFLDYADSGQEDLSPVEASDIRDWMQEGEKAVREAPISEARKWIDGMAANLRDLFSAFDEGQNDIPEFPRRMRLED